MITLASPAKVNVFLRILRRRADGYHELASLFQAISLCDHIHVALADQDHLSCTDPKVPTGSSNLIWKAVDVFRAHTGMYFPVKIHLDKHIPMEAGLGGGSGNAATALWALNCLSGANVADDELQKWGAEVGSDVPFFFSTGSAYCTGRGEIVRSIDPLQNMQLFICKPPKGLSTQSVYAHLKANQLEPRNPDRCLESFMEGIPVYFNDLEETAFSLMTQLRALKEQLQTSHFENVLMAGSGTSLVCFGASDTAFAPDPSFFTCQASYINRSSGEWYNIE